MTSDLQKTRDLLQEERDKVTQLEEVIQHMEEELQRLGNELQSKDKSISSLQFEKAALGANLERLKSAETREFSNRTISAE